MTDRHTDKHAIKLYKGTGYLRGLTLPVGIVDPLGEDRVLDLLDQLVLLQVVSDGMSCHVEQ